MNFTTQIYHLTSYKGPIITTILALVSIFLYANPTPNLVYTFQVDSPAVSKKLNFGNAPATNNATDSLVSIDSAMVLKADTIQKVDSLTADDGEIKDIINYHAEDSIVYEVESKKMYLYDSSYIKYQQIELNAEVIDFDWTTFTLTAQGVPDSTGKPRGTPVFSDQGKSYRASKMAYNFKSKKGKVWEVVTQEGDAYIHSEQVKKNENDEWYGFNSKYTSCDLDHPHFYFKARRIKMVPNKVIVTGPANLWIADVPTPLVLPFGLFPAKQGHKSGIIPPKLGNATGSALSGGAGSSSTFALRDVGYFWAVNDYFTLRATADVFSDGNFGVNLGTQYAKLYKFSGNVALSYFRSMPADPDLPGAKAGNNYSIAWRHQQDPRARPNDNFSAGVNIITSTYYSDSRVTDSRILTANLNSNVNYNHVFAGTPLSVSVGASHNQIIQSKQITFELPVIGFYVTQFSPLRPKVASTKAKWYENFSISYNLETKARLITFDTILFQPQSLDRIQTGIRQQFAANMPVKLLKYFNLTPAVNYNEWWYFKKNDFRWDPTLIITTDTAGVPIDTTFGSLKSDTSTGFFTTRNFSASISLNTKLTGIFKFKNKWVKGLKHIITPTLSFTYQPDFSKPIWRNYQYVQNTETGQFQYLNRYAGLDLYGSPGAGTVGTLNLSITQNFEMKVFSKSDTVNHEKKVSILDQFTIAGGYNFAAKEFKVNPISIAASSSRIFNLLRLNMNIALDPYAVDSQNRRINKFEWNENRKLLRFSTANVNAQFTLQSKNRINTAPAPGSPRPPNIFSDYVSYNPDEYYDFSIPWTVGVSYNFNVTQGIFFNPDTTILTQTVSLLGDFNLTPHWKIALSTGFDISRKQLTYTKLDVIRDLHCWELSFNWIAYPLAQQQFLIQLKIRSATLQDLKLTKRRALFGDL